MATRTRDTAAAVGTGVASWLGAALVIAAVMGLAAGAWALTVWFSGTKGAGDVHKDQNSATNQEHWSATYNNDYQQLQADQANLTTLQQAATGPGATQQDRTNYLGAQLNCRTDAATYNTDAGNVLGHQWIPAGLPTSVNASDYCGK